MVHIEWWHKRDTLLDAVAVMNGIPILTLMVTNLIKQPHKILLYYFQGEKQSIVGLKTQNLVT